MFYTKGYWNHNHNDFGGKTTIEIAQTFILSTLLKSIYFISLWKGTC